MAVTLSTAAICFIACHGGAANHFAVYAKDLMRKGHSVQIYATGPALKKFQEYNIEGLHEFSLEDGRSEEQVAEEIAAKCQRASAVITDVGHIFDVALQIGLANVAPRVKRIAYYDNPEPYVPGGYSEIASQVMRHAHKVLFANANLATTPIYQTPTVEVPLSYDSKIGLGYYPLQQAQEIAKRRASEQTQVRSAFFSRYDMADKGQKVFVYAGGNNEAYFSLALPACLQFVGDLSTEQDLSDIIIVLQQHPGAKTKNIDAHLVEKWLNQHGNSAHSPNIIISDMSTDEALVLADTMLYYQTSMGPQFVLAGIPTVQIGHECYEDILVKNNLCLVVNSTEGLLSALQTLQKRESQASSEVVEERLGICSDWSERLEKVVSDRLECQLGASGSSGCNSFFSSKYLFAAIAVPIISYAAFRLFKRFVKS